MKHEEMQVLVSAYYDGAVTPEEKALVEAHLAECAACAEALAAYRQIGRTVQSLPRGEPSRALWSRIREGLSPARRPLWLRLAPLASAVAVLVVGITLVLVLSTGQGWRLPVAPGAPAYGVLTATTVPVVPPSATVPILGIQGLAPTGTEDATRDMGEKGPLPPCAGRPLALDLVSLSMRSDPQRTAPRLQGVLYDVQGQPLPGVLLVISGTAGWQGSVSTAADGTFALDLPAAGTYRVVLAMTPLRATVEGIATTEAPALRAYEVSLPDGSFCLAAGDGPALAPLSLAANQEAILTLRSR